MAATMRLLPIFALLLPGGTPKLLFLSLPSAASPIDSSPLLRNPTPPSSQHRSIYNPLLLQRHPLPISTLSPGTDLFPSGDSFIRSVIQAWGKHPYRELRPNEVWFSILMQLNFYVEANAEKIRHSCVRHEAQETILVEDTDWTRVPWRFENGISARVKTQRLRDWSVPDFSTTGMDDVTTWDYLRLSSVTLLGEEDWEKLVARLDRLSEFGEEPGEYARRLEPILKRFVRNFEEPIRKLLVRDCVCDIKWDVWVCHRWVFVLGWITRFIYWDTECTTWKSGYRPECVDLLFDIIAADNQRSGPVELLDNASPKPEESFGIVVVDTFVGAAQ
ncbi:hypothetical protein VTI74DRAFT_3421 [Chaetomium olivicolor]